MQTAELHLKSGTGTQTFEMREGKPLFAGRTVECDLYLPSPAVSRRHAVFLARGGHCGVKDLNSSNGTYLNGKRITKSMRLKDGDVIQIATFVIHFRISEAVNYDEADKTVFLEPKTKSGPAAAPTEARPAQPPAARPVQPAPAKAPSPAPSPPPAPPPPEPPAAAEAADDDADADFTDFPTPAEPPRPPAGSASPEVAADAEDTPILPDDDSVAVPAPAPETPAEAEKPAIRPPSVRFLIPKPARPRLPERVAISDDEVGDGSSDDAFAMEEEATVDEGARDMALAKAAAEAGLVGEFVPDVDDEPSGGDGGGDGAGVGVGHLVAAAAPVDLPEQSEANPNAIPVDDAFRQAIETRLFLYSFLADMKAEREEFAVRRPRMADAVKAELARQDRELDKIPNAEQAENMIEKRRAKQKDLMEKIRAAKAKGEPAPPKPSRDMREAEEMAISQWTFCAQSFREALPAVYNEGYRLMRDEPLAAVLEESDLSPVALMGGGAYHLALEVLLEEAKYHRSYVRSKLATMPPPDDKKHARAGKGVFGLFGKGDRDDEEEDGEEPGESYAELVEMDEQLAQRTAWLNQEIAFMEKALIAEFWRVYTEVALKFLPNHEAMPFAVRAFLRHGVIGFKRWWMSDEVRHHLVEDVERDVIHHLEVSKSNTNVVYADEYLAAVMNWECTPAMDENLEINERNSPNWKADKALRKLINARSQSRLMEELLDTLTERIDKIQAEADALEDRISKLLSGSKNYKQVKNEMSQKRQSLRVEVTKLTNLSNKIKNETLANLEEAAAETRQRFDSGELPRPTREFLIKRECEAVHKIGRLLANLKERFMPLVVRDYFAVGTDAVNDRLATLGEILEMERRDPGLFLENIIPSKKKANRVDLRISPVIVLVPSAGVLAFSWNPRQRPEDGRLGIPTCFIRRRIRERQITYLLSDFRWDTSKAAAGMDIMTSETIVAAFMTVRWDWRKRSKEAREKGLIYTEQNDRTNWRRVYEAYSQSAFDAGKKLYNRNYDFYERIIGKYFDLPEGVQLLKK